MELLSQHIESLIFTSEKPIKLKEIKSILEETFEAKFKNADLENAIEAIEKRYEGDDFAFEMVGIADGYQFLTKGSYFNTVATFLKQTTRKRLSRAALETLSIIAYKQPVTRPELERIRGVSCDYAIHKLLEKEMVTILGRSESVGKALLYGTSEKFMDYFGLKTLNDMPKPKDFSTPDNSIGEAAPIEEDAPNPNAKPPLELPITELEEVVDMLVAILPPGPKVEIPESEEEAASIEEDVPSPTAKLPLELPITELEEVVDMLVAILPPGPKVEIPELEEPAVSDENVESIPAVSESKTVKKLESLGGVASELSEASNVDQAPNGNSTKATRAPIIQVASEAKATSDLENVVDVLASVIPQEEKNKEETAPTNETITISSQEVKVEEKKEAAHPTIAELFTEATKPKASIENVKAENVIPTIPLQEVKIEEKEEAAHPTIAQLFEEATKPKASIENVKAENVIPPMLPQEVKEESTEINELDEVVDVITASVPIENIPSESIVLEELIRKSGASSEEE